MVFSSIPFLFMFLPLTLGIYYALPRREKIQNLFIFLASMFFYAWGEPRYIFVMLLSISVDYFAGLIMWKFDHSDKVRKGALITSLVMNLALLGLFKYGVFTIDNINLLFGTAFEYPHFQLGFDLPITHLPIGISFFTFQSLSYTIDLYKRNIKVQKQPINFAAFVVLFPQLVAGPIVRYSDIAKELDNRRVTLDMIYDGALLFITGLGKKVLIANNIGLLWAQVRAMELAELSILTAWLGIIAFTFQIYFDFSGYSDMAIGLGKMLGFHFPKNFDYPYMSKSISEFWRRWHITLGAWFKSYVYFPLGGSRRGLSRTVINLAIVWLLTGIWHGASWNFIVWGVFYGVIIIAEKLFLGRLLEKIPGVFRSIYTMLFVIIGWVIFDTANLSTAFGYIAAMFGFGGNSAIADSTSSYLLLNYSVMLLICIFACTNLWRRIYTALYKITPAVLNYCAVAYEAVVFIFVTAYLVNAGYNPFLYFNF
ncbi:MAG: MBOAT family protein [Oscillospiraceae bacterium]|nr:MBOAT family protein [Oscillospiraceae bacterium]